MLAATMPALATRRLRHRPAARLACDITVLLAVALLISARSDGTTAEGAKDAKGDGMQTTKHLCHAPTRDWRW